MMGAEIPAVAQQGHLQCRPGTGGGVENEVAHVAPGTDQVSGHPLRHQGRVDEGLDYARIAPAQAQLSAVLRSGS